MIRTDSQERLVSCTSDAKPRTKYADTSLCLGFLVCSILRYAPTELIVLVFAVKYVRTV